MTNNRSRISRIKKWKSRIAFRSTYMKILYRRTSTQLIRIKRERLVETNTVAGLIRYLSKFNPDTPILVMDGYSDSSVPVRTGVLDAFGRLVLNTDKYNLDDIAFRLTSGKLVKCINDRRRYIKIRKNHILQEYCRGAI